MSDRYRIPITAITVFGTSALLALSVGLVLYLGLNQAAETTRQLWADQARTLIDTLQNSLDERLQPVRDQALWVAEDVTDLSDPAALDAYFFGVLAATPQVTGIAIITPDGNSRRWLAAATLAIERGLVAETLDAGLPRSRSQSAIRPAWRAPIFDRKHRLHHAVARYSIARCEPATSSVSSRKSSLCAICPASCRAPIPDTGVTPFVLYDRDFVLAHPSIGIGSAEQPLARLDELGDLVLQRIWTPDEDAAFISAGTQRYRGERGLLG